MKRITLIITALFTLNIWIGKSQMSFINYTDPNQIVAIEDDGNYFWTGTNGGLFKWFKSGGGLIGKYNVLNGLPSNFVHTIKKDHFFNELWVGTDNGIAVLNVLNQWTIYTVDDGLSDNVVKSIAIDLSGNKWLATYNGVTKYDPSTQTWTNYTTANGLIEKHVEAIDIDFQGNVWAGTWGGVSMFDGLTWTNYTSSDGLIDNRITSIATDDTKAFVWFGTRFGISKYDGYSWETYTIDSGLVSNVISSMAVDAQSNLWIGTGFGVSEFDRDTTWNNYKSEVDKLSSNLINIVAIDADGNKWFGNYNGVSKLSHNGVDWSNYTTGEGIIDNKIDDVTVDLSNNIWFATQEGISKYDGKHWTSYLEGKFAYAIAIDDVEDKWIGTVTGLIYMNDTSIKTFTIDSGMINNDVVAIAIDQQNNKWCASDSGVSVYNGSNWIAYTVDSGLVSNLVEDIAIDTNNNKWFATQNGVSMFNDTNWVSYTMSDGLIDNTVYAVSIDKNGNKWFGTENGLSKFNDTVWTNYTTSDGLSDNWIQDITFDMHGNIWIATGMGVSIFNGTSWLSYTSEVNGIAHNDVRAVLVSNDDTKWFGTIGGASKGICENPIVDFTTDTTCLPTASNLSNMSTDVDVTTIYKWDILNNDTIDYKIENVTHQFSEPGIYQVQLIAQNMSCLDSILKNVVVKITPQVSLLSYGSNNICSGQSKTLEAVVNNEYVGADYKYLWSGIEKAKSIEADSSKNYLLNVVDGNCVSVTDSIAINVVLPFANEKICMVTVDPSTGKNLVTWEKTENMAIASYNVYKLIGNQYSLIGNLPITNITVFEDLSSDPAVKAERYAITVIDTCGTESDFSPYHQTIHLGISQGLQPNEVVLDWTKYIDESGAFDPVWYYVYRGPNPSNMDIIDSLSSVIGTELNDPNSSGDLYYRVSVNKITPCDPANLLKSSNGPFSRSLSNLEDNRQQFSSLNEHSLSFLLAPNPAKDFVFIKSISNTQLKVIEIISMEGKVILKRAISGNDTKLDISHISEGIYIVKISNEEGTEFRRLIVE